MVSVILDSLSEPVKRSIDLVSFGALLSTIIGWLPPVGAVLSIFWIGARLRNELLEHRIKQQEYELNKRRLRDE
jgi:uncharacterized membrane protein YciS (DUF1049 family)